MRKYFIALCVFALTNGISQTLTYPVPVSSGAAGSPGQVQFNSSGAMAGASNVTSDGSVLRLGATTTPTSASGESSIFGLAVGASTLPAAVSDGLPPYLISGNWVERQGTYFSPAGFPATFNSTLVSVNPGQSGTGTWPSPSTSNPPLTTSPRYQMAGTTSPNQMAGLKGSSTHFSSATNAAGGFMYIARVAVTSASSVGALVGISGGTSNPSVTTTATSVTNFVGIGYNSGDANWSIVSNDASGNSTMTTLGASFPTGTSQQGFYEIILVNYPPGTSYDYRVTNLQTGASANGSISSNIPAQNTAISHLMMAFNYSTGVAPVIQVASYGIETTLRQ